MAVCVLPGTELAFATKVSREPRRLFGWKTGTINQTTTIFRQINKDKLHTHHDALEFPDGQIVLLTHLIEGQQATVLQLPAEPATATGSGSVRLSMRRGLSQRDAWRRDKTSVHRHAMETPENGVCRICIV
jgi:hypothetical protein